jgi:hypothetical protein
MTLEVGKVYAEYECGCIFPASVKSSKIALNTYTKGGSRQRKSVCPEHPFEFGAYKHRMKICPVCEKLIISANGNLLDGQCRVCGRKAPRDQSQPIIRKKKSIFQAGVEIEKPDRIFEEINCIFRADCLTIVARTNGKLHCGDCKKMELYPLSREIA